MMINGASISSSSSSSSSLLCCSTRPFSHSSRLLPFRGTLYPTVLPSKLTAKALHSTATQEIGVENAKSESEFIEVGYLSSVHGVQGEICVKPSTDFPELRFSKPGRRWLKQQVFGKDTIKEVELVEGRGHPAKNSWILSFGGINTSEQARQLVGSTFLVREEDRPDLEEGDFYTRDLVGMRVVLKETCECVGTVVNVFNTGASDLLQVMRCRSVDVPEGTEKLVPDEEVSGPLVWVPFVEAIVPDVDMAKREMLITPPKGLLELNIRSDERSKKERRQLEWKERKKFQRRLIAAKKKLCEMDQKHVFDGLRYGEKSQRSFLADEIVGINSKLLQLALQTIETSSRRWSMTELMDTTRPKLVKRSLKVPKQMCTLRPTEEMTVYSSTQEKGLDLFSNGKVGVVLVVNDIEKTGRNNDSDVDGLESSEDSALFLLQKSLSDDRSFLKMEDRAFVPLVVVCPKQETHSFEKLLSHNEYFGFDTSKVWILEEEKLPVVSCSKEEQNCYKILMKSPWEVLQSPVGSGGVISSLSAHNIPEKLDRIGAEYIEVCSVGHDYVLGNAPLVGFVESCKAEIGVQISEDTKGSEESLDMVFRLRWLMKKQIDKLLQLTTLSKLNSHVKLIDKEWTDIVPSSPNSYHFSSSIYSCLNDCPLDKICVMEITE